MPSEAVVVKSQSDSSTPTTTSTSPTSSTAIQPHQPASSSQTTTTPTATAAPFSITNHSSQDHIATSPVSSTTVACVPSNSSNYHKEYEATPAGDSFVPSLATVLTHLVSLSPAEKGQVTRFHAVKAPDISIRDYLERIQKYFGCSNECFVLSLVYIDRIVKIHEEFTVSVLNIHRLLITSVMLAAKFFDDVYYSNAFYARVGGVRTKEINLLEWQFLSLVNYHLYVSPREYDQYLKNVLAAVNAGIQHPLGSPPQSPMVSHHQLQQSYHTNVNSPSSSTLQQYPNDDQGKYRCPSFHPSNQHNHHHIPSVAPEVVDFYGSSSSGSFSHQSQMDLHQGHIDVHRNTPSQLQKVIVTKQQHHQRESSRFHSSPKLDPSSSQVLPVAPGHPHTSHGPLSHTALVERQQSDGSTTYQYFCRTAAHAELVVCGRGGSNTKTDQATPPIANHGQPAAQSAISTASCTSAPLQQTSTSNPCLISGFRNSQSCDFRENISAPHIGSPISSVHQIRQGSSQLCLQSHLYTDDSSSNVATRTMEKHYRSGKDRHSNGINYNHIEVRGSVPLERNNFSSHLYYHEFNNSTTTTTDSCYQQQRRQQNLSHESVPPSHQPLGASSLHHHHHHHHNAIYNRYQPHETAVMINNQ